MKKYCYVNGKIVEINKPQVALNDLSVLRGYAVFDFARVSNGVPLFWQEHLARFRRSAKTIGLAVSLPDAEITKMVQKLLQKNKVKNASARLILSGGPTDDGITPRGKPILSILIEDEYRLPNSVYKLGAKLMTTDYERLFPEAKTTNYLLAVSLQKKKRAAKALEILYTKNGKVFEASTSNLFMVTGKKIITPKAEVLPGITRAKTIMLAKKAGYEVEEREVLLSEVRKADEVFLTATNKDVTPIVKVDDLVIGAGKPGPVTQDLLYRYCELVLKEVKKA
jgi:branched-subunit amino acid aminotransferase/4-amino-4-deoxychorismate lyase